ncbi:MAG: hypothetical protein IJK92_01445 [Bacteroidales bacterium]|nr:hypothetical protein [Bacteroidales bacterium]
MEKQILLDVQTRLSDKVPVLRYIDKDWGQLNEERPAVNFPCAVLDVDSVRYEDLNAGYQNAEAVLTVTIADLHTLSSSAGSPQREDAFAIFDIIQSVHNALQHYASHSFVPLVRISMQRIPATKGYECYELKYATAFKCEAPPRNVVEVMAGLSVTPQYQ